MVDVSRRRRDVWWYVSTGKTNIDGEDGQDGGDMGIEVVVGVIAEKNQTHVGLVLNDGLVCQHVCFAIC